MISEDEAGDFHDVHLHPLQSQGNIYTLSNLLYHSKEDDSERRVYILASTLNRRSFALECSSASNQPRISSKEIHFTYIPSGAEIISIDAFRREDLQDYVVGITIIIKASPNAEGASNNSGGQFFNIYNDEFPLGESLAHNCQSLELDFIPYQLTHAPIEGPGGPPIWLLSGSDARIHPYAYEGQVYSSIPLADCFPELLEEGGEDSIIQWLDVAYNGSIRLTAAGREDGLLRVTRWDVKRGVLMAAWVKETMEDPITCLRFFGEKGASDLNLVVVHALSDAKVFHSVNESGLSLERTLKNSHCHDVPTSVLVADVNFDGRAEILLGTYGQVLLCYGLLDSEWVRQKLNLSLRRFPAPILNLDYIDLSGDGIMDLVVMTTKGLHVLQLDRRSVIKTIKKRLGALLKSSTNET